MNLLTRIRQGFAHKPQQSAPFFYVPGPVFTEPAMAAIFHTTLANPPQRTLGAGYPIAMQFRSQQPPPLYAQPGATIEGIGIQLGQYAIPPLTGDDGSFTDDTGGAAYVEAT